MNIGLTSVLLNYIVFPNELIVIEGNVYSAAAFRISNHIMIGQCLYLPRDILTVLTYSCLLVVNGGYVPPYCTYEYCVRCQNYIQLENKRK